MPPFHILKNYKRITHSPVLPSPYWEFFNYFLKIFLFFLSCIHFNDLHYGRQIEIRRKINLYTFDINANLTFNDE